MPMRRLPKIGAFLLIVIFFVSTTAPLCEDAHACEKICVTQNDQGSICSLTTSAKDVCPDGKDSSGDHCSLHCSCICHVPFVAESLHGEPSIAIVSLAVFEPFTALPEVYLEKFIPPDILA